MSPRRGTFAALGALLALAVAGSTPAQAPVCDGISEVTGTTITSVRVTTGLVAPVLAVAPPGDVDRLFLLEQDGFIRILRGGAVLSTPFLDIDVIVPGPAEQGVNVEEGLLGLAFHPSYATNGHFFVYHTNLNSDNVVARYTVSANPDVADPTSRQEVITFAHPGASNHNGGMIAFSPVDGYLYIGTGDGGGGCDPSNNSQNGASNLGKLIRLDVDSLPATIPTDNPFVGNAAVNDEIWALGLRNPWRWSFDRINGDLYLGDVGQFSWEEVDWAPATSTGGENFGWDVYEGTACASVSCGNAPPCIAPPNLTHPVTKYPNGPPGVRCAVTGGFSYRGCRLPDLHGTYFFGDWCTAFIRTFQVADVLLDPNDVTDVTTDLVPDLGSIGGVAAFGEDARGELYIVDRPGGELFKIVPVLTAMEVSGSSATPLSVGLPGGDWSWEDLQASSSHPLTSYRVWRQDGRGPGPFDCVFEGASPGWVGGDPQTPNVSEQFTYLVTAVNSAGEQTSPGTASDHSPRLLSAAACP